MNFGYLKIIHTLHPHYHPKIIGHILKNNTHVKKVGHTSEFLLAFIDELEKQIFIEKTVEVGPWKQNNFDIYNVAFLKKI